MNPTHIIRELEALGRWLDMAYLPKTASGVRALLGLDLSAVNADEWHSHLVSVYREEVSNSLNIIGEPDPAHHRALVAGLDQLVPTAAANRDAWLGLMASSRPAAEAMGESHGNTRELYQSFSVTSSRKHVYINLCVMYLVLCEGVFPNIARLLLGFNAASRGDLIDISTVATAQLARHLDEIGMAVFSAGYDRHIRNAIAHGHFTYEPDSGMMRFRDYGYREARFALQFEESWPLDQFARRFATMDDVYLVVSSVLAGSFPATDSWSVMCLGHVSK